MGARKIDFADVVTQVESIGKVAKACSVTNTQLIHWEEKDLIRCVRDNGGARHYFRDDYEIIKNIAKMTASGKTTEIIKHFLREEGKLLTEAFVRKSVSEELTQKKEELEKETKENVSVSSDDVNFVIKNMVSEFGGAVHSMNNEIAVMSKELRALKQMMEMAKAELDKKDEELRKKDEELKRKDEELANVTYEVQNTISELHEKDDELFEKRKELEIVKSEFIGREMVLEEDLKILALGGGKLFKSKRYKEIQKKYKK